MSEKLIVLPPNPSGNGHDANYRLTMMVPKRRYFSYLRERWWVVVLCLAAAVSAMLVYETVHTETYSSFGQIYLSGDVQLDTGSIFSEESMTYFGTQIELLKSERLQNAAFQKAGITVPPGQKNPYKVDIVQPMKTSTLQLQANGPDPALTQRFLQALIDEYMAYKKETRISTSEDILSSLQDQLAARAANLQAAQDKWADFQKTNNVAVLEEVGKSAGSYLSELNLELAKSKLKQKLLSEGIEPEPVFPANATAPGLTNTVEGLLAQGTTNSSPSSLLQSLTNVVVTDTDSALNSARLDLAILLGNKEEKIRYMGEHGFDQEVERLQRLIPILEEDNRIHKTAELRELEMKITAIEAAIPEWEAKILDINDRLSQNGRLKGDIAREQGYYDHLLGTLQNVDLGKNVQHERLSVLQSATPSQPEKRSLPARVALAGVGGLFFSVAIVFVWYLLDDRFVSVRDIKDQFGETILGLVPQIKAPQKKPQTALLADADSRLGYVESYRHLRSALLLSSFGESRPQTLLITSTSSAEGKTTIAINLARLLARSGLRVVLVDADTRGGGIHRLMDNQDQPGVLDYLRGEADAKSVVQPTEIPGLRMVPGGTHKKLSEGLFLRPKLADLIQDLRRDRDFVILDGAPILSSDDAALLVPHSDAIILVTRPFYTHSRLVRQALDMLYQRQAKHVSIILNRARADDLAGHYAMNGYASPVRNGKI